VNAGCCFLKVNECNGDLSPIGSLDERDVLQIRFLSMHLTRSLATILVLLSATACNRKPGYDWQTLTAPDGTFSVSLPGNAVVVDTPTKSATGGSFISHNFKTRASKDAAYGCSWWEDPSRPKDWTTEKILDTARESGLSGANAKLLTENRITFLGHPARDIRAIAHGKSAYDNRIVLVGNRLYTLLVVDVSGKHDTESIERFFNSLQFH
jgi:hypothetical protein